VSVCPCECLPKILNGAAVAGRKCQGYGDWDARFRASDRKVRTRRQERR